MIGHQMVYGDILTDMMNTFGVTLPGFTKFDFPEGKVSFQYPSDWSRMPESAINEGGISFGSPVENDQRAIFTMFIANSNNSSLDTFKETRINQLTKSNPLGLELWRLAEPVDLTLSGLPAFNLSFYSPLFEGLNTIEITTVKDDRIYIAKYIGHPDAFNRNLDAFNKIISTVKIQ